MYAPLSTIITTNNHDSEKSLSAIRRQVISCAYSKSSSSKPFETSLEIVHESDFYFRCVFNTVLQKLQRRTQPNTIRLDETDLLLF